MTKKNNRLHSMIRNSFSMGLQKKNPTAHSDKRTDSESETSDYSDAEHFSTKNSSHAHTSENTINSESNSESSSRTVNSILTDESPLSNLLTSLESNMEALRQLQSLPDNQDFRDSMGLILKEIIKCIQPYQKTYSELLILERQINEEVSTIEKKKQQENPNILQKILTHLIQAIQDFINACKNTGTHIFRLFKTPESEAKKYELKPECSPFPL